MVDTPPSPTDSPTEIDTSGTYRNEKVPYHTIFATIGCVIATYVAWLVFQRVSHILSLIAISVFISLVLNPAVDTLEYRFRLRRSLAASLVFLAGLVLFGALLYLFVQPLVNQTRQLIDRFPEVVQSASNGEGAIGRFVQRYNIDDYVRENQPKFRDALQNSTGSIVSVVSTVASTIATLLTVLVLAFMNLLYGRNMIRAPLMFFHPSTQQRIARVSADAAKSVTGYMVGNLLISAIAGAVTFVTLTWLGVDFAIVLSVWVAFADLIPLVGATLGAIPTVLVAALHSPTAGIISFVVYVVYQQIENHLIQPNVMARTVNLNPLVVLVSALLGVAIAGLLGALLAIPVAGAIQVIGRDLIAHRTASSNSETYA